MRLLISSLISVWREDRVVHQTVPDVSANDVGRIVRRDFPREQFDSVMAVLTEYQEGRLLGECSRVQLAALKLAQGNLESLRRHIANAQQDYRDVLSPAEYPEYTRAGFQVRRLSRKRQQRIVESDWQQYQRWLREESYQDENP